MSRIRPFLAVLMLLCALFGYAAKPLPVQRFEGGLGVGRLSFPLSSYSNTERYMLLPLFPSGEIRFNIPRTAWDVGITFYSLSSSVYRLHGTYEYKGESYSYSYDVVNNCDLIGVCSHYNLRQGRKVNPFFGLAAGIGLSVKSELFNNNISDIGSHFAIEPRVGVEFLYHIRLCADIQISRKGFNTVGLTLGFAIGGRPKKPK